MPENKHSKDDQTDKTISDTHVAPRAEGGSPLRAAHYSSGQKWILAWAFIATCMVIGGSVIGYMFVQSHAQTMQEVSILRQQVSALTTASETMVNKRDFDRLDANIRKEINTINNKLVYISNVKEGLDELKTHIASLQDQLTDIRTDLEANINTTPQDISPLTAQDIANHSTRLTAIETTLQRILGTSYTAKNTPADTADSADNTVSGSASPFGSGSVPDTFAPETPAPETPVSNTPAPQNYTSDTSAANDAPRTAPDFNDGQTAKAIQHSQGADRLAAQIAISDILQAITDGQPFDDDLQTAIAYLNIPAPDGLHTQAQTGVTSLATLRTTFAGAARDALASSRQHGQNQNGQGDTSVMQTLYGFFNLRSLTPQQGMNTDAILSRAQAALQTGDLARCLTQLNDLSDTAKAAMQVWLTNAQAHVDAKTAIMDLRIRITQPTGNIR